MTEATQKTTKRAPRKVQTPKASPAKTAAKAKSETKAAREPMVNAHVAAGINVARYTGPSKFVNANRKPKVMVGREVAKLTDRAAQGLYALRECYGSKDWQPRGFDNGVLRDLLGAGMIEPKGGVQQTIDGTPYLVDGSTPVSFKLTTTGMAYGKA